MRSVGLIAVLVVSCLPAFAQFGASALGRADVGVAITNEVATGIYNPAALVRVNDWDPVCPEEGDGAAYWEGTAGYTQDTEGYADEWGVGLAARKLNDDFGIGIAFADFGEGDKGWAFSYGKRFVEKAGGNGWSWGLTARVPKSDMGPDKTLADLGVLFTNSTPWFGGGTWSFGVVGRDIFDEWGDVPGGGTTVDAGLALTFSRLRLAADVWDVFSNTDVDAYDDGGSEFAIGAEHKVCKILTVRTGYADDDWCWGFSARWRKLVADYGRMVYDDDGDVDHYGEFSLRYIAKG